VILTEVDHEHWGTWSSAEVPVFPRAGVVVPLLSDSTLARPGGRAYLVTEGEHEGAWSSEPGPNRQATRYRFHGVTVRGGNSTPWQITAHLELETPDD